MVDPKKLRVFCPVAGCEDPFVADTNKKNDYNNVHFFKVRTTVPNKASLFKPLTPLQHRAFTTKHGVVLLGSPDYIAPPGKSIFGNNRLCPPMGGTCFLFKFKYRHFQENELVGID
ncbi:Aste57867_11993 [Aphanomyces stellatus]|uniref:Aste57867_11993 protein n=1 Tax=Aphanomyces stellatus TaxID=120398 RepID=A0A485KUE8_9STRA|nr:hypothetical protein As57867_011948 [Aphanomyces stellatus]VFT88848.1 Aste57867_11993 [Aphanomyces stellatus]